MDLFYIINNCDGIHENFCGKSVSNSQDIDFEVSKNLLYFFLKYCSALISCKCKNIIRHCICYTWSYLQSRYFILLDLPVISIVITDAYMYHYIFC